jgi:hypothetical protein
VAEIMKIMNVANQWRNVNINGEAGVMANGKWRNQ